MDQVCLQRAIIYLDYMLSTFDMPKGDGELHLFAIASLTLSAKVYI